MGIYIRPVLEVALFVLCCSRVKLELYFTTTGFTGAFGFWDYQKTLHPMLPQQSSLVKSIINFKNGVGKNLKTRNATSAHANVSYKSYNFDI
jgi:hypothetical protein